MADYPLLKPKKTKSQAVISLLRRIKAISKPGSEVYNMAEKAIWILKD